MKSIISLSLLMTIFLFISCNKDEPEPTPAPPVESVLDYYPLEIGNYWVYQRSGCDSTWENCDSLDTDTTRVVKDTIINNHTYFKLEGYTELGHKSVAYLRDSSDYIVSSNGNIIFSNKDFESILKERYEIFNGDTIFYYYVKMEEEPVPFESPAGVFECLDRKMTLFIQKDNFEKPINIHHLFAKGVGPVFSQAVYAISLGGYKMELVDYHVAPEN